MSVRPAIWVAAVAVVVADQATKQWALSNLQEGVKKPLIGDWLSLELVFNDGAAFSLGTGYTWVLTIIAVLVTAGIVYYARRAQSAWGVALFGIGLGGAVGNLIDRLFRDPSFGQGHVVDMINYNGVFVGNVADIAIVGAAAVFVLVTLLGKRVMEPAPEAATAQGDPSTDDAHRG